ncbi:hypothetical protein CIHG_03212 [Coccidioides immitis H538.4]|uniref:Uncharacterized protein n=2 Tax=Coccidioides immitis TaxID=5501 RepID=A0A0J8RJU0_COCIT|nr:hypothetical protein CIRG_00907 [Coccidioides immitis RMSCC 2394]KMU85430.1 hypothetical protein CIHG_03212 [Coccidioides immitis H538.4]
MPTSLATSSKSREPAPQNSLHICRGLRFLPEQSGTEVPGLIDIRGLEATAEYRGSSWCHTMCYSETPLNLPFLRARKKDIIVMGIGEHMNVCIIQILGSV